jgi:hypothetical protein
VSKLFITLVLGCTGISVPQLATEMMTFLHYLPKLVLACSLLPLLLVQRAPAEAMTDKATGISFPSNLEDLNIFGVGVRKKGPIKVFSVGMYCSQTVQESLSAVSRAADKGKEAFAALRRGAQESPTSFVLRMNFKVGAEKMASAIAESVSPRHSTPSEVDELKSLIFSGVSEKGAAVNGTVIQFDCSADKGVDVSVDGKDQGCVSSPGLAKSFCDVYLDDKCVSPTLRESILENCCAP